jgi:O-antigen ligase
MTLDRPVRDPARGWGAAGYLTVILGTEVVVMVAGVVLWREGGGTPPFQLALYLAGLVVAGLLWLRLPAEAPASGMLRVFLLLALALWLLEVGRRLAVGVPLNPVWITVPLLLGMALLKPPDPHAARRLVDAMALVFMGAVVVTLLLESLGVIESWYTRLGFTYLIEGDKAVYWIPLAEPLGLTGRWAGPFPHPNMAGPVGGFLVVVGLCRRGWLRATSLTMGLLVLVLTASRTSLAATALGVAVVISSWWLTSRSEPRPWIKAVTVALAAGAVVALVVRGNTGLSGRTSIWPEYLNMWLESPWVGVPDARISLAAEVGQIPDWAATAHNLLLDSLVRFGLVGASGVVAALAVAGVMAFRAAAAGNRASLGIIAVIVGCALTEALIFWRLLAVSTILLFVAVLGSAGPYPPVRVRR